jgi:hypothetical protein
MNRGIGSWTDVRHCWMSGLLVTRARGRAALGIVALASCLPACSRTSSEPAPVIQTITQTAVPPPPQGATGADPSAEGPPFLEPVGMPLTEGMRSADRWLAALRSRNQTALVQGTQYPFEWLDSRKQGCTAKQPATSAQELAPVLECLLADAALLRALEEHDRAGIQELPSSHLQDWAQAWRSRAPADATLVNAFIKRNDGQVDIDLWLVGGKVRALWTHVEDGTSAVNVAERWLDALKRQDMAALAQATAFGFEVRDTGQGVQCGKRVAAKPAQLDAAVRCLLNDRELQGGLAASKPIVEAAGDGESVPSWAERWWTSKEHSALQQTFTTVTNPGGVSFDLILMTGPNGVRAVWKLGSRESRE